MKQHFDSSNRPKLKETSKSTIVKRPKSVVKVESDVYVWSLFTMQGILYTNSKEQLEEEANILIRMDKTTFHVKTVHVDRAAADVAHNILQHKFKKMSNNKLKEFMTNKETSKSTIVKRPKSVVKVELDV